MENFNAALIELMKTNDDVRLTMKEAILRSLQSEEFKTMILDSIKEGFDQFDVSDQIGDVLHGMLNELDLKDMLVEYLKRR